MTWGPIKLRKGGEISFVGESEPAPGGGSQPGIGQYAGAPTAINDGDVTALPISVVSGDALLDLTTPDAPTFVAAGAYFVTANAASTAPLTPGGIAGLFLPNAYMWSPNTDVGWGGMGFVQVSAGDPCLIEVGNYDGASARTFGIALLYVVKIA